MNYKKDTISYSSLKAFAQSPNHYIQYLTNNVSTPAMRFGTAAHCYILEPEEFSDRYAIAPSVDRRTARGKEIYNAFVEVSKGRSIITLEEANKIEAMSDSINNLKVANDLLNSCKTREKTVYGEINNLKARGIIDAMSSSFAIDLKTTIDASSRGFKSSVYKFKYHVQAALYLELTGLERFYWIAVESTPPFCTSVFAATDETIKIGREILKDWCERFEKWDGTSGSYSEEVQSIDIFYDNQ